MPAMNTTIVKTVKDLPLPQSSISYRNTPDGEWIYAEIFNKAGKVKTNNRHYMNIKQNSSENGTCGSLKGTELKKEDQQSAAPNDTSYKRLSCHSGLKLLCKFVEPPCNGGPTYRFLGMPAMRTRWMAGVVAPKSR